MIGLLIAGITFFALIEYVIIPLSLPIIKLGIIRIPFDLIVILLTGLFGLLAWYYITIKYFWIQINKMKIKESKKVLDRTL